MSHARGAPFHPQTQGKIKRWHQTLKNRMLLENYFPPGGLERRIEAFFEHYNHRRTPTRPGMADHGRVMRCISFTEQLGRTWKCLSGRLSALGLRRDPHGYVKQIHHEELKDGDRERPSTFPRIMLKQTDSGIQ